MHFDPNLHRHLILLLSFLVAAVHHIVLCHLVVYRNVESRLAVELALLSGLLGLVVLFEIYDGQYHQFCPCTLCLLAIYLCIPVLLVIYFILFYIQFMLCCLMPFVTQAYFQLDGPDSYFMFGSFTFRYLAGRTQSMEKLGLLMHSC